MMSVILLWQFNSFYGVVVTLSAVILSTTGVLLGVQINLAHTFDYISVIMLGTGVVVPAGSLRGVREDSLHHLMIVALSPGNAATYYAGAGWTSSGDFASAADWERYLSAAARGLRYPLVVSY